MERKQLIKQILLDWQQSISEQKLFQRESYIPPLSQKYITTLTGPRRAGKTSVLRLLAHKHTTTNPKSPALYINFEDERLENTTEELSLILDCYRELYPDAAPASQAFFFDEIQIVPNWEKFLRRCHESERAYIAVTGSNSKALSSDIATSLRGRTINAEILPLSLKEYLQLKGFKESQPLNSRNNAKAALLIKEFLTFGGFPDIVLESDPHVKRILLQEYFQVMILRDLVERFKIQQVYTLKYFLKRLLASAARPLSINKIYLELKSSGHKISKDQLYEFLDHAESVYFARRLEQYSKKTVNRQLGERKIYPIDNGYLWAILGNLDLTKSLEVAVWFELFSRKSEISYFKSKKECDFITTNSSGTSSAIQVAYSLEDKETKKREFSGLSEACSSLGLKSGKIITLEQDGDSRSDGLSINISSFMRFAVKH
jgi:predicted AAA+ superfamily ATPase